MDQEIDKSGWRVALDRLSKSLSGKRAEIEIAALSLGDQIAAEWLPVIGITYDPKDDIVEVAPVNYTFSWKGGLCRLSRSSMRMGFDTS